MDAKNGEARDRIDSNESLREFDDLLSGSTRQHYVLTLYVTGMTKKSVTAIENLRTLLEANLRGSYELDVVDIYQQPEKAKEAQLIAAPTLLKRLPLPEKRLIGDMSQTERVLVGLNVKAKK